MNNNSTGSCVIHLRDDTIGDGSGTTLKPVPVTAPMTLQQFRGCLGDISSVIECDNGGAPLKRGMIMTQSGDVLQPGHHYIVRRDVVQQQQQQQQQDNDSSRKGVTFSSMATVREYSLSFVSQSPMHTAAGGGGGGGAGGASISSADLRNNSLPQGFGVASLFRHPNTSSSAPVSGAAGAVPSSSDSMKQQQIQQQQQQQQQPKLNFPFTFEHGGSAQQCSEQEFRQMMQRDFVGEAQKLGRELDGILVGAENRNPQQQHQRFM